MRKQLLVLTLLAGCMSLGHGNAASEDADFKRHLSEQATLKSRTTEAQRDYLSCMAAYGHGHASGSATAAEIGEAAVPSCAEPFRAFSQVSRALFDFIATDGEEQAHGVAAKLRIREAASREWEATLAGVVVQGKQAAIRAVVEARP